MGTGSSVHPLPKPMFSAPSSDEPGPSRQDDNPELVATPKRADCVPLELTTEFGDASTEATGSIRAPIQTEGELPNFGGAEKDSRVPAPAGAATITKFQPLLRQSATTLTLTSDQPLLTSKEPRSTLQSATRSQETAASAVQPYSSKRRQRKQSHGPTINTPVYVPLLKTRAGPPRFERIEMGTRAYSGAKISQQKTPRWSAPATKTSSDEIQIHIGRIEVTAIPPPAATPKPKRPAKGPSLQEYLTRRDKGLQ
jgi:hypothetical protein